MSNFKFKYEEDLVRYRFNMVRRVARTVLIMIGVTAFTLYNGSGNSWLYQLSFTVVLLGLYLASERESYREVLEVGRGCADFSASLSRDDLEV